MEITARGLWTLIHGIGFGALYLLACSGAIVELWRRYSPAAEAPVTARDEAFLSPALAIFAETMVDVRRGEAAQAATNLAWGAEIYGSIPGRIHRASPTGAVQYRDCEHSWYPCGFSVHLPGASGGCYAALSEWGGEELMRKRACPDPRLESHIFESENHLPVVEAALSPE